MPNRRKKDLALLSAWIMKGNKEALYAEAKRQNISPAKLLDRMIEKNSTDICFPEQSADCTKKTSENFTQQEYLTREQVARLIKVSSRTVDRLLVGGKLKRVKFSDSKQAAVRIPYRAVLKYLKERIN